jgi:dynein heavy chain
VRKDFIAEKKLSKEARIHDEELNDFFLQRVQANFHLMICMSKTGDALKNYIRMFPGLVNNTTCIWYLPWPREALVEVANHYLKNIDITPKLI